MLFARPVSLFLRSLELGSALIVAGLAAWFIHRLDDADSSSSLARLIYTLVVAALSALLSLLWLIPFSWALSHWHVDAVLSISWWVSFGLLIDWSHGSCHHEARRNGVAPWLGACGRWESTEAFAFLSALLWFTSALVDHFWVRRHEQNAAADGTPPSGRRWFSRSAV